jgi:S1-C subfamily serine protease
MLALQRSGDAVVHVYVEVDDGDSRFKIERPSSGVIVHERGLVVTLWSLIREVEGSKDKTIYVACNDAARSRCRAKILAKDEALGICLLELVDPPSDLVAAPPATGPARPGTEALTLARPDEEGAVAFAGVTYPAAAGTTISDRPLARDEILLTDARSDRRMDGGAVLDAAGNLLGILSTEHVLRQVREPTLEQLQAPNYAFSVQGHRIREAFKNALQDRRLAPPRENPFQSVADATARIADAVVAVHASDATPDYDGDPMARRRIPQTGSGVIVSAAGLVLTNAHIAALAQAADAMMTVKLLDGRSFRATVRDMDKATNIAVLQIEDLPNDRPLPVARCGTDADLRLGEPLIAVGNPTGDRTLVSAGVLSARRRGGRLQADPDLNNSNAGGAMVDCSGRLVGIVDGGAVDPVEVAFHMRGDRAKADTNLSTSPGIDAVRKAVATGLEIAAETETIRTPSESTGEERALRATPVTEVVERHAAAMLNIYVSWTSAAADEAQNPFASVQRATVVGKSLGSGVIIDRSGLALSNWHVVDDASEADGSMRKDHVVQARLFDGRKYDVKVLSISREDDLALLQLQIPPGEDVHAIELGSTEAVTRGETVLAIGNPLGYANTITAGIVTAKDQSINVQGRWAKLENLIETDAAINGGNSGGALIDLDGRLVGINSAGSGGVTSRGYAINVDHVRRQTLELLLTGNKLRSPNLGMIVKDKDGAIVVTELAEGGPAELAGIRIDDTIQRIDGLDPVWSPGLALHLLSLADAPLRPVSLEVARDRQTLQLEAMPMSANAWAVWQQCGLEVTTVTYQQQPETVRAADIAMFRRFSGSRDGEPLTIQGSMLHVVRRQGVEPDTDIQPGDLLLAVEFAEQEASGLAYELVKFKRPTDAKDCFNSATRGSYEGRKFRCWVFRDGKIHTTDLLARRLLP